MEEARGSGEALWVLPVGSEPPYTPPLSPLKISWDLRELRVATGVPGEGEQLLHLLHNSYATALTPFPLLFPPFTPFPFLPSP